MGKIAPQKNIVASSTSVAKNSAAIAIMPPHMYAAAQPLLPLFDSSDIERATEHKTHSSSAAFGRLNSHDGSTLLRAHPAHKTLSLERQASIDTRIPDMSSQPTYTVEAAGFQVREHKIKSRLSRQSSSDGSSDEEPLTPQPRTPSTSCTSSW